MYKSDSDEDVFQHKKKKGKASEAIESIDVSGAVVSIFRSI